MSVYFIKSGDLIKIGFSGDVKKRVEAIIRSLREPATFMGCMPGGRDLERFFHKKFAADREYGEWFRASPALEDMISATSTPVFPGEQKMASTERLQAQEERYADEASYFIHSYFDGLRPIPERFDEIARVTSISAIRLESIYRGEVCPVTAGEYVILRQMFEVSQERSSRAAAEA